MPPREEVTPIMASCLVLLEEEEAPVALSVDGDDGDPPPNPELDGMERMFHPLLTREASCRATLSVTPV